MSDENQEELSGQDELATLKARATLLGIKFHPSIGLESLKEKIKAGLSDEPDDGPVPPAEIEAAAPALTAGQLAAAKKREAAELVRCRVVCMNPAKKEWEGEIFCVGNSVVGTFKKMVPFNVDWHVPRMILSMIQERKCQLFKTITVNGHKIRKGYLSNEFAVEILTHLTPAELRDLAQRQAMANGTSA